jgi:coenzyme F420 biosynthesis associated uncharacterized protein
VSERSFVDWALAERVAATVAGSTGDGTDPSVPGLASAAIEAACADGLAAARAYTGLEPGAIPEPELIGRREWAQGGLGTLRSATHRIEDQMAGQISGPGPLGAIARSVAGAAAGAEAGVAVGYAARRVLGQYDVAVVGPHRPARLLFVGPNLATARAELGVDARPFLRWIATHELTHALQFGGVPWLADHVRALVTELIELAFGELDLRALAARLLRSDPRQLIRSALRGELVRILASDRQRQAFDRLQATMSAIEGHAEHVAEACAADLDPEMAEVQRRAEERRRRSGGLGEAVGRLLGLDAKLRQYRLGKAFCDEVVRLAGPAALNALWASEASLPNLIEIERPRDWLDRVTTGSPAAA